MLNGWQVYNFLGLSVGCIIGSMNDDERREAHACDITYGTNNEFGFDYLRDNLKFRLVIWYNGNFAIVDEVDQSWLMKQGLIDNLWASRNQHKSLRHRE